MKRALFLGPIGTLAVMHLSLVGMVDTFQGRDVVVGIITLGSFLPLAIAFLVGNRAGAAQQHESLPARTGLGAGALAGAVLGAGVAAFALLVATGFLRPVLVNATEGLVEILQYGLGAVGGSIALVVGGALVGLLGASLHVMPQAMARAVTRAGMSVVLVSLLEPFLGAVLRNLGLGGLEDIVFAGRGVGPVAAIVIFFGVAAGSFAWTARGGSVRQRVAAVRGEQGMILNWFLVALTLAFLIALPQLVGQRLSEVVGTVGIFILLGLGLNIVVGFAGLLDLGYVAFYAVGAYTTAVLTSPASPAFSPELPFWAALPIVIVVAATLGVIIGAPVLRLRGDYLAIVTLGFGEIARILFLSAWLQPYLGGAQGITPIPAAAPFTRQPQSIYYPILFFCILGALVALSLASSRVGRAWNAMREDESVAEATGINTIKYKLLAFAMGGVFGSIGGAFFSAKIGTIFPDSFSLLVSINALALIILGGMGNIPGVIVGAIVLVGLPELLREFAEYRLLIYGMVLVAMMLLRPEGLLPSRSRRAELHDQAGTDVQWNEEAGEQTARPMVT